MYKLLGGALLCAALTGCAGMNSDFDCNKTATDQCLSMSDASRLAAKGKSLDDVTAEAQASPKPAGESLATLPNGRPAASPDRKISTAILAGGDRRLLEAHHEAVKETLAVMEQMVSARDTKDGVTSIVPTGKMVAALFTHDTSRNLDPQIHTHAVLANVTELDGKWKALATDYMHGAGFIETRC